MLKQPGFSGPDAPEEGDLYKCVHCGLCLNECPTYLETGLEAESPRGRIALMKAVYEGRIPITDSVLSHWELCLQCRACEVACPSGVPYGRLMEGTRAQIVQARRLSWKERFLRWLAFQQLLPHPRRLYLLGTLGRLYQRSGLRRLLRRSGLLRALPWGLGALEEQLPHLPDRFFRTTPSIHRAQGGPARMRVALLSGCVMPIAQAPTMEAAVRVLTRNGCDVLVPERQVCCGALSVHVGERQVGRRMARRNIDVFLAAGVERIVVASAGCGSTMKEYRELLKDDSAYAEKAERFSQMTVDITEFLASLPLDSPKTGLPLKVTYQDSCHLAHAQRIKRAPRQLLEAIPGLELIEMEGADHCCGAAGIYSIVRRDFSRQLLRTKMQAVAATGVQVVATANPGCVLQLQTGLKEQDIPGRACHVIDLLDEAYALEHGATAPVLPDARA